MSVAVDETRDVDLATDAALFEMAEAVRHRLASGPSAFASMLDVASSYGLPVSEVLGWSLEDQAAALGHLTHQRQVSAKTCPSCGTHEDLWTRDREFDDGKDPLVAVLFSCRGCQILHNKSEELADDERPYLHPRLVPPSQVNRGDDLW